MRILSSLIAVLSISNACSASVEKNEAVEITKEYLENRFEGEFPINGFDVHDADSAWTVEYRPPEGWIGGRMTVTVDKESGNVVGFRGDQ